MRGLRTSVGVLILGITAAVLPTATSAFAVHSSGPGAFVREDVVSAQPSNAVGTSVQIVR
jgi:hypothetical protein